MSDTTPRPDETPGDPTAPPTAPRVGHAAAAGLRAAPAYAQPQYAQPGYTQQLPPAYPPPGTAVAGPNPMSPTEERTTGMAAHGVALAATVLSGGFLGFVAALVMYLVFRDRGPVRATPLGERAQRPDHRRHRDAHLAAPDARARRLPSSSPPRGSSPSSCTSSAW